MARGAQTNPADRGQQERQRSHLCQLPPDRRLHRPRGARLHDVGGDLGLPHRVLLLLHHPLHHRVRRLRARDEPGRVGLTGEAHLLRPLPRLRPGAHRHVLRPHAGGSSAQVSIDRTSYWTAGRQFIVDDVYCKICRQVLYHIVKHDDVFYRLL